MITLLYDSTKNFIKVDEIRDSNDSWYVGNNMSNRIDVLLSEEMEESKFFPTLSLLTPDRRQIFPIVALNVHECLIDDDKNVYHYENGNYVIYNHNGTSAIVSIDDSVTYQTYTAYTFELSTDKKTITTDGLMTIQVVMNEMKNDLTNPLNNRDNYRKTIDSIVVSVRKGYSDAPILFVSNEQAIDDIYALARNANETSANALSKASILEANASKLTYNQSRKQVSLYNDIGSVLIRSDVGGISLVSNDNIGITSILNSITLNANGEIQQTAKGIRLVSDSTKTGSGENAIILQTASARNTTAGNTFVRTKDFYVQSISEVNGNVVLNEPTKMMITLDDLHFRGHNVYLSNHKNSLTPSSSLDGKFEAFFNQIHLKADNIRFYTDSTKTTQIIPQTSSDLPDGFDVEGGLILNNALTANAPTNPFALTNKEYVDNKFRNAQDNIENLRQSKDIFNQVWIDRIINDDGSVNETKGAEIFGHRIRLNAHTPIDALTNEESYFSSSYSKLVNGKVVSKSAGLYFDQFGFITAQLKSDEIVDIRTPNGDATQGGFPKIELTSRYINLNAYDSIKFNYNPKVETPSTYTNATDKHILTKGATSAFIDDKVATFKANVVDSLENRLNALTKNAPENFDTLLEVANKLSEFDTEHEGFLTSIGLNTNFRTKWEEHLFENLNYIKFFTSTNNQSVYIESGFDLLLSANVDIVLEASHVIRDLEGIEDTLTSTDVINKGYVDKHIKPLKTYVDSIKDYVYTYSSATNSNLNLQYDNVRLRARNGEGDVFSSILVGYDGIEISSESTIDINSFGRTSITNDGMSVNSLDTFDVDASNGINLSNGLHYIRMGDGVTISGRGDLILQNSDGESWIDISSEEIAMRAPFGIRLKTNHLGYIELESESSSILLDNQSIRLYGANRIVLENDDVVEIKGYLGNEISAGEGNNVIEVANGYKNILNGKTYYSPTPITINNIFSNIDISDNNEIVNVGMLNSAIRDNDTANKRRDILYIDSMQFSDEVIEEICRKNYKEIHYVEPHSDVTTSNVLYFESENGGISYNEQDISKTYYTKVYVDSKNRYTFESKQYDYGGKFFSKYKVESITKELEDKVDALSNAVGNLVLKENTFANLTEIASSGQARDYFEIGDQISYQYKDYTSASTYNEYEAVCNVIGFEDYTTFYEYDAGEGNLNTTPSIVLEWEYLTPNNMIFSPSQAWLTLPNGLPAGTYSIKMSGIKNYDNWQNVQSLYNNKYCSFTLTQDVPINGQLRGLNIGTTASSVWGVRVFSDYMSDTAIESIQFNVGDTLVGTYLGCSSEKKIETDVVESIVVDGITYPIGRINYFERVAYGSNRYYYSCLRRWLNSRAPFGEWYVKSSDVYEVAPSAEFRNKAGFLYNCPKELFDNLKPTKMNILITDFDKMNAITHEVEFASMDEFGVIHPEERQYGEREYDQFYDYIFPLTCSQMCRQGENFANDRLIEGNPYEYYKELAQIVKAQNPSLIQTSGGYDIFKLWQTIPELKKFRIESQSTSHAYWQSSSRRSGGYYEWCVSSTGHVSTSGADFGGIRVAPACKIGGGNHE